MIDFEILDKDYDFKGNFNVNNNILTDVLTRKLILKDVPLSVMIKDSSGKIDPFYLAYNVYARSDDKYEVYFSRSMKFRKEIYYQLLLFIFSDVYRREKYVGSDEFKFLSVLSYAFRNSGYDLFKLVPLVQARNISGCWNKRIMNARIGDYDYYVCNFVWCKENPKRRKSFLMWREKVVI